MRGQGNPEIGAIKFAACASATNGDLHVLALDQTGGLWHTLRNDNGDWPAPRGNVRQVILEQTNTDIGSVSHTACAVTPNGDLHVIALDQTGRLLHTLRNDNGNWPAPWGDVRQVIRDQGNPDVGSLKFVSCTTSNNGDLRVLALDQTGRLLHTLRNENGNWPAPWGDVRQVIRG